MNEDDERVAWRERVAIDGDARVTESDALAVEAPLEIRINGVPIAVVMRTPGDDLDLVRGFLLTEGIASGDDVTSLRHCTSAETVDDEDNVVQAVLAEGLDLDLGRLRRNLFASSSCGVCGKASIEQAMRTAAALPAHAAPDRARLLGLPERLREDQVVFGQTGGLHAAGLYGLEMDDGAGPALVAEDVGRHNAVDKVVGRSAREGVRVDDRVLAVSGRVSFEVVQKALAARIPVIAAVSAPTSLAVDLARASGITLVGFVRDGRLCVYSGEVVG